MKPTDQWFEQLLGRIDSAVGEARLNILKTEIRIVLLIQEKAYTDGYIGYTSLTNRTEVQKASTPFSNQTNSIPDTTVSDRPGSSGRDNEKSLASGKDSDRSN